VHYDEATGRIYLFTASDPNAATIEGSVIIDANPNTWAASSSVVTFKSMWRT